MATSDRGGGSDAERRHADLIRNARRQAEQVPRTDEGSTTQKASELFASHPHEVGLYKIVDVLGEGGMGSVYLAEQQEPIRRRVALKLIKLGMDSKQVLARFNAERQALSLMNHPNIAKVLDAGTSEDGRPYFVMEYVAGERITEYCNRNRLDTAGRLRLFLQVCAGVQHAHQKAVIHRDIKPSNILVTEQDSQPVPKIIDFGVAKAIEQRLEEQTRFTEHGQLIGTPEYMSPEQALAGGADVDTRSDVYSLGVVLYELLAGTLPFEPRELRRAGIAEIQRIICEEEPPKPSATLTSQAHLRREEATALARQRQTDTRTLARQLHGDLDWIIMKALDKDRGRRYATAQEFAADIRRHLHHEPVTAGPPSVVYRLRKFVRRNRAAVIAGNLIAVALAIATGVSIGFAVAAGRDREAAEAARIGERRRVEELEQVAEFQAEQFSGIDVPLMAVRLRRGLVDQVRMIGRAGGLEESAIADRVDALEDLLAGADLTGLSVALLEENVFARALAAAQKQFADQPLVRARLLHAVASALINLGLLDAATVPQREAVAIRRRLLGNDHPLTLASMHSIGTLLHSQGSLSEAEHYWREVLEHRRRILGNNHQETLASINAMGVLLNSQGKLTETELYWREALETRRRVLGDDHPDTMSSIHNMGTLLDSQGKLAEAEPYYREAIERKRRILGNTHPNTLASVNNMGMLLYSQGRLAEAETYFRDAFEGFREEFGDDHSATLTALNNLAALFHAQGKFGEAEPYFRRALDASRSLLGDKHPNTLLAIHNMGFVLQSLDKLTEAEVHFLEALDSSRRVLGDDHPSTIRTISATGLLMTRLGRLAEAEALGAEAVRLARETMPKDHTDLGKVLNGYGSTLVELGLHPKAEDILLEAHEILNSSLGAGHARTSGVVESIVSLYDAWHVAEPGKGYDAKAADWRAKLSADQGKDTPEAE